MSRPGERRREQQRLYYQANKEKAKASARAWSVANPEQKKATRRAYYTANRASIIEKSRLWETANPERKRERNRVVRLRKVYGITPEQHAQMLVLQGSACAICAEPFASTREMHVDHNHHTGKVRALLCGNCNKALGHIEKHGWKARAEIYLSRFANGSILDVGLWRGEPEEQPLLGAPVEQERRSA